MSLKDYHTALRYDDPDKGEVTVFRVSSAKIDREMRKAKDKGYANVRLTTLLSVIVDGREEMREVSCDRCGGLIGVEPVLSGELACMACRFATTAAFWGSRQR